MLIRSSYDQTEYLNLWKCYIYFLFSYDLMYVCQWRQPISSLFNLLVYSYCLCCFIDLLGFFYTYFICNPIYFHFPFFEKRFFFYYIRYTSETVCYSWWFITRKSDYIRILICKRFITSDFSTLLVVPTFIITLGLKCLFIVCY